MKIQSKRKGKGIRAILCGLFSVFCIAACGMNVYAGYTSDNHPRVQHSPDGSGWTIIDELPYYEDYNTFTDEGRWNGRTFSFWSEQGEEYDTGIPLSLPNPGVGQHEYAYKRRGYVPVYKWITEWDAAKCIHTYNGQAFGGFSNLVDGRCYGAYWSGLIPYCADCGESLVLFAENDSEY